MGLGRLIAWSQLFFFFSGATGLVYQVLWTRRLTLTFGHTVLAVSTVLAAFMTGLAVGSLVAGRWTDNKADQASPQRWLASYGALEGLIGVWAILTLPLLTLVERFYVDLSSSGVSGLSLHLLCFVGACLVLVPPTTAMGATVPILTRLLVFQRGDVGHILSRLYGLNTLGALSGAALAGFVLLPRFGLTRALLLAATVNLAVAAGAIFVSRRLSGADNNGSRRNPTVGEDTTLERGEAEPSGASRGVWLVPLSFAVAGAASMAYQVGWTRSISLAIGSSVYAFSGTRRQCCRLRSQLADEAAARRPLGRSGTPSHAGGTGRAGFVARRSPSASALRDIPGQPVKAIGRDLAAREAPAEADARQSSAVPGGRPRRSPALLAGQPEWRQRSRRGPGPAPAHRRSQLLSSEST